LGAKANVKRSEKKRRERGKGTAGTALDKTRKKSPEKLRGVQNLLPRNRITTTTYASIKYL